MISVDLKITSLRTKWAHHWAESPCVSDGKWKAKSLVRQHAFSSGWPGEEKPLAARLSGVEVSLSSAIKCLPLSPMNHRITAETVHCCLKASVPLIHVSPSAHLYSPLPALVINPSDAPSYSLLTTSVPVSFVLPLVFSDSLGCLLFPGMTEHSWWIWAAAPHWHTVDKPLWKRQGFN